MKPLLEPELMTALRIAHKRQGLGRPPDRVAWNLLRIRPPEPEAGQRVCVLGAPGAGKSSLILALTDDACVPPPYVGPETDATNWSADHFEPPWHRWAHLAFVDGPGHGTKLHPASSYAWLPLWHFNCLLFVVAGKVQADDERLWHRLVGLRAHTPGCRIRVVRNRVDAVRESEWPRLVRDIASRFPEADAPPLLASATDSIGIEECRTWIDAQ